MIMVGTVYSKNICTLVSTHLQKYRTKKYITKGYEALVVQTVKPHLMASPLLRSLYYTTSSANGQDEPNLAL